MKVKTHNYKKLNIWTDSIELSVQMYELTKQMTNKEQYGLINQIRRASVSVPSNIAEGSRRTTPKEFNRFLSIAQGSLAELYTQLVIGHRIGEIKRDKLELHEKKISELENKIYRLRRTLQQASPAS